MKNLKILLLLTCAYTGAALARVMNVDSAGAVVAAGLTGVAADTKVLNTNVLMTSCFDEKNKVLYLGDTSSANTGAYSLLRVNFDDAGNPSVTTLGQLAPDFFQLGVVSIQLLDSGKLLVVVKGTAPSLHFCIITNPSLSSAAIGSVVSSSTSPTLTPFTGTPVTVNQYKWASGAVASVGDTPGDILNVMAAGQDSSGNDRIVVTVVKSAAKHLSVGDRGNASTGYSTACMRTVTADAAGVCIVSSNLVVLKGTKESIQVCLQCKNDNGVDTYSGLGTLIGEFKTADGTSSFGDENRVFFSSFYWDKDLKKLYIGINRDSVKEEGAQYTNSFVLVGNFDDTGKLLLDVVSPIASGSITNILSFQPNQVYKVWSMNMLKTAGYGYRYLIMHIESTATSANTGSSEAVHLPAVCGAVYAIPLNSTTGKMAKSDAWGPKFESDADASDGFMPGAAGSVSDRKAAPAMDVRALVGGRLLETLKMTKQIDGATDLAKNLPLEFSDVRVFGDSVYVVRTAKNEPTTAGIWMSSPLYDSEGSISAWTPWRRVVSSGWTKLGLTAATGGTPAADVIKDAYLAADGKCYFVAGQPGESASAPVNVVGSMNWAGPDATSFSSDPLVSQLNADFSDTGVWTAKEFPAYLTNGLAKTGLTVFASRDKLALAVTGGYFGADSGSITDLADATGDATNNTLSDKGAAYGAVYPKTAFSDATNLAKHYKLFTDLDGIGAVYCVEVARTVPLSTVDTLGLKHGFVFVGGENGLAVLRKADGSGFQASIAGITLQGLGANLAGFSFKRIPDIEGPVIGLASTTGYLYVLTNSKLYRIRLQSVLADYNALFPYAFDITQPTNVPVMFKDGMTVVKAAKTSLANVSSSGGANLGESATSGQYVYDQNTVVVQSVLEAGAAEYFVSMVGCPNTGPLFVAAIEGDHSNIYAIKNTEAPAVVTTGQDAGTAATDWAKLATENYNVFNSLNGAVSDYKQTVPYHVRKMYLRSIEQLYPKLWGGSPVDTLNGLYMEGPNFSSDNNNNYVIANLFILSGSVFDLNSKLYGYPIWGNAMSTGSEANNPQTYMVADQSIYWLGGWDPTLINYVPGYDGSVALGYLANGLDFAGLPIAYSHADVKNSDTPNLLLFQKGNTSLTSQLELDAKLGSNALVYGSLRLENGCQLLYGYPFGVQRFD